MLKCPSRSLTLCALLMFAGQCFAQSEYLVDSLNSPTGGLLNLALAGDVEPDPFLNTQPFKFRSIDRSYDSRKYSKTLKIKGWQVSEGVYFGSAKIAGKYGPGFIIDREGYSWGFNHRGVQLHIPLD